MLKVVLRVRNWDVVRMAAGPMVGTIKQKLLSVPEKSFHNENNTN